MGNYLLVHATLPLPAPTPPQHLHAMFFLNITTRPEDMSTIENHLEHVTSDEERFQSFFVYYVEEILHYQHLKQQAYLTYSIVSTSQIHRLTQQHTIYSYTSISPDEILLEMDDFENEIVQGMKLLEQLVLWNVIYRNYQHMLRACITMGMDLGAMISEKPFAMISTIDDTALIRACREGYVDLVKHLVEVVGVDVNTMNNNGDSALLTSIYWGRFEIVKYLMQQGANAFVVNHQGNTTLCVAARGFYACSLQVVEWLIHQGVDLDACNDEGVNALMLAAGNGRMEVAKYLVDQGADVHIYNQDNCTAVDIAQQRGRYSIANYILLHSHD